MRVSLGRQTYHSKKVLARSGVQLRSVKLVSMVKISFTPNLARHVDCPDGTVDAATVKEALDRYFEVHPGVRDYVLDEHAQVRKHMVVFVDGVPIRDRTTMSDAITPESQLFVFQALSGG